MKFRKKPVVVEAMEYIGYMFGALPILHWLTKHGAEFDFGSNGDAITIHTLEGDVFARPGDWVIRGIAGEFYPCKPEIFAETYEPAEDSE